MNTTTRFTHHLQTIHKLKPLREDSDELPSFEEAFNPDYLRQFFKSTEGSSQSPTNSTRKLTNPEEINTLSFSMGHSPYGDHFYDDTQHSVADTNDTYISPQKDTILNDKGQLVSHLMQLAKDSSLKPNVELNLSDPYTQGIYAALNGVNYSNSVRSDLLKSGNLETTVNRENLAAGEDRTTKKKKVFLIIRNAVPIVKPELSTKKASDKSSSTNVEKGTRKGRGQRTVKDRLKSADNINLTNYFNNSMSNEETSLKRRGSYAFGEDFQIKKKVKGQKGVRGDLNEAFEFDLDADKDFKPGYFDILPTISFDEIINREYPEFNGNAFQNNHKC